MLQVKDRVDKNLVKENDNIRKYMQQIKVDHSSKDTKKEINVQVLLEKVDRTLEASRQAQDALNRDLNMKDVAFGIDQTCLVL